MDKISGVYKITNKITGDFYIGSSKDIKRRWRDHIKLSQWKAHPNTRLYKDMFEFGLDNFLFEIIEETDNLKEREQYYIEQLKPSYNNYRAQGFDTARMKETSRQCNKEWYKINRDECLAKKKAYRSRLCFYEGETLTLNALTLRLRQQGIVNPTLEAKKYLISNYCKPNTLSQ